MLCVKFYLFLAGKNIFVTETLRQAQGGRLCSHGDITICHAEPFD